jgi:hypothetical protein
MQKTLFFLMAIGLSVAVNAQKPVTAMTDTTANTSWARLTDTTYTLRFPNTWTVDQSGLMGSRFFLFSPLDSLNDTFRENFNLIVNDMAAYPDITLEYIADGARAQVESIINEAKMLEFRIVHNDDFKYYLLEYSGKQGKFDLHWKQRFMLFDHRFYVLTFTAEAHQFDQYLPTAERIFDSFSLK